MKVESAAKSKDCSCYTQESLYIKCSIGKIWEALVEFDWAKLCPTNIKSCTFLTGNSKQIGSTYKLELKDGSKKTYRIVEISELKRKYSMEMIECEPKENFYSVLTTIKLYRVTDDNNCIFKWESWFSNDVTPDILKKRKETIRGKFKDLKLLESKNC